MLRKMAREMMLEAVDAILSSSCAFVCFSSLVWCARSEQRVRGELC